MKRLCWETTGFSFGLALAVLEGAMIHVENKHEGTASNMLHCMGMTMAQQLLSFTEGTKAGSEGGDTAEVKSASLYSIRDVQSMNRSVSLT